MLNGYLRYDGAYQENLQRDYIVVKAFGAINYHEPLIFKSGWQVTKIISAFDLQRGTNLQAIFYKKFSLASNDKNNKWRKITSDKKFMKISL